METSLIIKSVVGVVAVGGVSAATASTYAFAELSGSKARNFSGELVFEDKFLVSFNKPGDCLKNLFLGIEKHKFFQKPTPWKGKDLKTFDINEKVEFSINPTHAPNAGCFQYHKKGDAYRIEISLQTGNEGWFWMSGFRPALNKKPDEIKYDFAFREAYLKNTNSGWDLIVGQDGEGTTLANVNIHSYLDQISLTKRNPKDKADCNNNSCTDITKIGIWEPSASGQDINNLSSEIGKFVFALSDSQAYRDYRHKGSRNSVFRKSAWFTDARTNQNAGGELLIVKKSSETKGNWKDLVDYCADAENNNKEPYKTFCAY